MLSGSGPPRTPVSSASIAVISSLESSKSKTSKFSAMRPGLVDLGIAERPSCTCPSQHHLSRRLLQVVGVGGLDGHLGLSIAADYARTFFDVHLKGAPADSLARLAAKYPQVQVEPQ